MKIAPGLSLLILGIAASLIGPKERVRGVIPCTLLERLEGPEEDPMHMPSQVLLLDRGRTLVLDGANGRVALFQIGGVFQRYLGRRGSGEGDFMDPLDFCLGPEGSVIIADTGNGRILLWDEKFTQSRSLELEGLPGKARPTGVAFDPVAGKVCVTDAGNHAVLVLSIQDFRIEDTIHLEPGLDGIRAYPCYPTWRGGKLFFSEPLNGRVQWMEEGDESFRMIRSTYLYRPKGTAVDAAGRLYVSDGWQGTIAVFGPKGEFLGRLGDGSGRVRYFASPAGLAFDERGRLLVVEMENHCVLRLEVGEVDIGDGDAPSKDPEERSRRCLICHPEWLDKEEGPSSASHPRMCLSCHDGTVAEHRATAFALHGHQGMGLPPSREAGLDLDGELTCMTCHEAHASRGDDYDMATTIFLQYPGPEEDFCRLCHGILAKQGRIHYMGPMEGSFPESLVRAGASPPRGSRGSVHCRACHLAHGRGEESLLVLGPYGPCLACHPRVEHKEEPHARSGLFACRDCHRSHALDGGLLFREKPGGQAKPCAACHRDKEEIKKTSHNLSRIGDMCQACHSPYPDFWALDPGNGSHPTDRRCRSCHSSKRCTPHPGGGIPGPRIEDGLREITCTTCHDPHSSRRLFLKPGVAQNLCASCHGPEALWHLLHFHDGNR